jgi:hypothetical protein
VVVLNRLRQTHEGGMPSRPRQQGSVKREKHGPQATEPIAPRWWPIIVGIANDRITKMRRQRPTVSPRKTVSENPVIDGQGDSDQHGAAVVICEMQLLPVVFQTISICAVHLSTSNGLGLTEDRLRLDRLPATAAASFFPPRVPRFASRSKKPSAAVRR